MNAIKIFKRIEYKKYTVFIILIVFLFLYLFIYIHKFEFRKSVLEISFLSTPKSRSVFIKTPKDKTILYGAGDKDIIRSLTKLIPFYKRRIDYVFIPSAMPNQINGLISIFDRYEIGKVFIGEVIASSTALTQLNKMINKNMVETIKIKYDDTIDFDDISIKVNFPILDFKFNKTSLPELGVVVIYKNTKLYLLGNLSKTIQKEISKNLEYDKEYNSKILNENIIELFNSGIESKLSPDFINKVKPKYIHNTKTKNTTWFSNGISWEKGD